MKCLPHGTYSRNVSSCYDDDDNDNDDNDEDYDHQQQHMATRLFHWPNWRHCYPRRSSKADQFLKIKHPTSSMPISLAFIHGLLLKLHHSLTLSAISVRSLGGHISHLRRQVTCQVTKWERTQKGNEEMLSRPRQANPRRGWHPPSIPPRSLFRALLTKT